MLEPFYNPTKTYEQNFEEGPFGAFADSSLFQNSDEPKYDFLGQKVFLPFGIPAGPLINEAYVKAALDKGFDICTYKTVRSSKHATNPWPNVLAVKTSANLTFEQADSGVLAKEDYAEPLSITNSFGVPSRDPDFWQEDMKQAALHAKPGQVAVGSFQGTVTGSQEKYIQDFALCARLVKETGVKILEVNLSCPNEGSANLLCFDLEKSNKVVEAIKNEIGNSPLIIKLAYYQDQPALEKFLDLVGNKVQAVSTINTIPAKIINAQGKSAFPDGRPISGVCGASIKWAGLEMVQRLKTLRQEKSMNFAIIGVGGVMNTDDYGDYISKGADAVMSATGAMWNPFLAQEIKKVN